MSFAPTQPIQLVILDIDGTLVGHSNELTPTVKAAVQRVKEWGIPITIATGRMYQSALRFYQELDLQLPLLAYQGAWIQTPQDPSVLYHKPVPLSLATGLLSLLDDPGFQDGLCIHLYINDRLYVEERGAMSSATYAQRSGVILHPMDNWRSVLTQEPTKLLILSSQAPLLQRIWDLFQAHYGQSLYLTRSTEAFVEATHPHVNKGTAVTWLAQHLGIPLGSVMAIGDNYNDLEMIQDVGWGVAMGNAPEAVKAVAQWVAPSVDADGVAVALDRVIEQLESRAN